MANRVYISAVSIAKLMKKSSMKIEIDFFPVYTAEKCGFELLSAQDVSILKDLPFHH